MNKKKRITIVTIATLVFTFVMYYIYLPAINIKSEGFWFFVGIIMAFVVFVYLILPKILDGPFTEKDLLKKDLYPMLAIVALIALFMLMKLFSSEFLRAKSYSKLISSEITEHDFQDYKPTLGSVPLLDKDSAMNIANRRLGGLQDVISQFEINDTEQITVRGVPSRVACLDHAGFYKWLTNKKDGTPGFIKVDMNTQEAELFRVEGGIKYTKSDYFGRNLERILRFKYPTKIFWESTLELDENDHPYWVTGIIDNKIGLFGGQEVVGAVLLDAVTGDHLEYAIDEIPEWIDNVYGSDLLLSQYDSYGMYEKGYLNSMIGQKGVKATTEGYNYIPQGDDNWIYTGVTSVGREESNIGFVLINKRTKETHYYEVSGAEEFSAMESAQGAVQHLGYKSTFPLLLKIENQPTYLVSLKDSGGLVKMYGMVNVGKYQIVATGNSIENTLAEYKKLLRSSGTDTTSDGSAEIKGVIEEIRSATIDGNSVYFIKLKGEKSYYMLDILDDNRAGILDLGDSITLESLESDDDIIPAKLK